MYHTQEKRPMRLTAPIVCVRKDAWLGRGYYFWDDEEDALAWGYSSKKRTGQFEMYEASIDSEKFLNTVFNEEHYIFFKRQVEKAGLEIAKKTGMKPTVEDICDFINEKAQWVKEIDGILFQDLPAGHNIPICKFPYRKRIQAAVYKIECVKHFRFKDEYKTFKGIHHDRFKKTRKNA